MCPAARLAIFLLLLLTQAAWAAEPAAQAPDSPPPWGWLGVRIRELSEQEMEELTIRHGVEEGYGVVLVEVLKGGPAEAHGLRPGDVVVAFEGRPIVEVRALQRLVGGTLPGKRVNLLVLRDGKRQTLPIAIGPMPAEMVAERVAGEYGFVLRGSQGEGPARSRDEEPVVVAVADRSPAKRGGLEVGDRIVRVNGQEVRSLSAIADLLRGQPLSQPLDLEVLRQGRSLSLRLPQAVPEKALP